MSQMSGSRLVYYSIAAGRPEHDRQFSHSVATLRRHNPTVDVHLFVYNSPSGEMRDAARRHRVEVHALGDWRTYLSALSPHGSTMGLLPTLHKVLSLAHLPAGRGDRVLYVDCDTHFFADVELLFDTYRECDFYAREEPYTSRNTSRKGPADPQHVDEAALEEMFRREGLDPVIPFNTGVMLFNHGVWSDIDRSRFIEVSWRLMQGACLRPLKHGPEAPGLREGILEAIAADGPDAAMAYPSQSFWILDEVALWVTLGGHAGLTQGIFDSGDVMQDGEFGQVPIGVIAHYFSSCEAAFFAWAGVPDTAPATEQGRAAGRVIDDGWRSWIAENLLLDATPAEIRRVLGESGFGERESAAEVGGAQASPYIRGAERLRNRLRKREWVLAVHRKLDRLRPGSGAVERRSRPGRDEFFDRYYCGNRPGVITGMMDDWPALGRWGLDDLAARFGDREVDVQFGHELGGAQPPLVRAMPLRVYATMVRAGETNDFFLSAQAGSRNGRELDGLWDDVVQVPEYLDGRDPRAGAFLLSPAGSVTPFRHGLANALLAQVAGSRRFLLAPSWDLPLMGNHHHMSSWLNGREVTPSPGAGFEERRILECVVGPGEMLFLPVGWMSSATDLEVSASMSFTNFLFDNDFQSFYTTREWV